MILKSVMSWKVVTLFLLVLPIQANTQTLEEYIEKGRHCFNVKGAFDSSIHYATLAIGQDSNYSFAYYLRAFSTVRQNKVVISKALPDIQKAITLNPDRADYYDLRGFIYDYLGKYPLALQDYNKAIGIEPEFARAYYHRGVTYVSLEDYKSALADLNLSIELDSTSDMVFFKRGIVFMILKQNQKSLNDFSRCIRLNKNYADAYYNRGVIYDEQENYDKALVEYNKAYKLDQ